MTSVTLRFGGGLENIVGDCKRVECELPADVRSMGEVIPWIRQNLVREKHDMFAQGAELRPGILVLINDVDWELYETTKYTVESDDEISFVSTLHGG